MKVLTTVAIAGAMLNVSVFAAANSHTELKKIQQMYKETAVFNHVVGDARFVGNFMADSGRCNVTMFETRAEDGDLRLPLRRYVLPIAAGARSTVNVGPNSALAIRCAPKADAIGIEAETRRSTPNAANGR